MNLLTKILFGICAVLILATGIYATRLKNRARDQQAALVKADSIRAVNDTLRRFQAKDKETIKLLGDSLQIVTTSVAQGKLGRGLAPGTVTSSMTVKGGVKGLSEVVMVPIEGDTVKRFNYLLKKTPFTIGLQGVFRPSKDTVDIKADVNIDPIQLRADIICRPKPDQSGIRRADVYVSGPTWLNITGVAVNQQGATCNPQSVQKKQPWFRPQLVGGLGWSWQESKSGPAVFVGIGVGIPLMR